VKNQSDEKIDFNVALAHVQAGTIAAVGAIAEGLVHKGVFDRAEIIAHLRTVSGRMMADGQISLLGQMIVDGVAAVLEQPSGTSPQGEQSKLS